MTQLEDVYGPNHPFTINCDIRTYNTPNDNKTAEGISVALGVKTELIQQKTYTGHRLAPWLAHMMIADQETARPLLTPGEVLTFSNEETLVFVKGMSPLRARKLRYFQDGAHEASLTGTAAYIEAAVPLPGAADRESLAPTREESRGDRGRGTRADAWGE